MLECNSQAAKSMANNESTHKGDSTQFFSEEDVRNLRAEQEELHASLIIVAGEEIGREIDLSQPEMIIGRGEEAGVRIFSRSVSRSHARITRAASLKGYEFMIHDMGSMNGILVNNVQITSTVLRDGDKVQLGDVVFKFMVQDAIDAQFHEQIHRLIHFDQLTGLMTMDTFRRVLDDTIRYSHHSEVFSLAMTDLDGLKKVNDTLGHLAGRKTVAAMGMMMRAAIRPTDRAGLYGGDEAIVLYPKTPLSQACDIAEGLRRNIEARAFEHNGRAYHVTISQGLAEWPLHGRNAEEIIAAADSALYRAKADGRNCVRFAISPQTPTAIAKPGE